MNSGRGISRTGSGARTYRVVIESVLDDRWSPILGDLRLARRRLRDGTEVTLLTAVLPDQAALRGLLWRLWNLNLTIRSMVSRVHRAAVPHSLGRDEEGST